MGADQLAIWVSSFSYPLVFILLLACGMGAPLSEELILVVGGLVVAHGHGHLPSMILTGVAGAVVGDQMLYHVGRKVGSKALNNKRLGKLLTPKRVAWIEGHFKRNGLLTVFVARFLPGLRAPTFLVAGISRFPLRRFVLADALGASITAPLLVWLGYHFGANVLGDLKIASRWILLAAVLAVAVLSVRKIIHRSRRVRTGEAKAAADLLRRDLEGQTP